MLPKTGPVLGCLCERSARQLTILLVPQEASHTIPLSGQGRVPEVPLCAMCKVDGCFVLIPINEITQMRPDMSNFVRSAYAKDELAAFDEDADYTPPAATKAPAKPSTSKASTSKSKASAPKTVKVSRHADSFCTIHRSCCRLGWRTCACFGAVACCCARACIGRLSFDYSNSELQVEVKKRETDRQIQIRTRSYTHWREQLAAEEVCALKPHGITSGNITLIGAAKTVVQQYAGDVAMGVPRKEYLKYLSPAVYLQRRVRCAQLSVT